MAKAIYTAEATVTGGRAEGHGVTSDGALDVQLRPPVAEGTPEGTNPEQLFAVGYAACFESALGAVARRQKVEPGDVSVDSKVSLYPTEERGYKLGVELDVTLPAIEDPAEARGARRGGPSCVPVLERDARQHRGDADRERSARRLTRIEPPPGPGRAS